MYLSILKHIVLQVVHQIHIDKFHPHLQWYGIVANIPKAEKELLHIENLRPLTLLNTLYKLKTNQQKNKHVSTYGYDDYNCKFNLFLLNDPIIKRLKEDIGILLSEAVNSNILITDSFFTIFRSGGELTSHNHLSYPDKYYGLTLAKKKYSAVYYLSIGDQDCEEPGILKLEDPEHHILPTKGLIVLFPASRNHSVFYKGQKDRIILGINFYAV